MGIAMFFGISMVEISAVDLVPPAVILVMVLLGPHHERMAVRSQRAQVLVLRHYKLATT
jgi:hypothetical protein